MRARKAHSPKAGPNRMVVLSAAVITKSGKALVARQFVEMPRIRVEGLLAAFPKLKNANSQHTFVETEHVRYLYQPLEVLELVLVTTKLSNIIEDLATLRLLSRIVRTQAPELTEESVLENAFDLVFAFDEAISNNGHFEHVTLEQVNTNLEMDSHEEKLFKMIRASKESEAIDQMKRKAVEIREQQRDAVAKMKGVGGVGSEGAAVGGGVGPGMGGGMGGGGMGGGGMGVGGGAAYNFEAPAPGFNPSAGSSAPPPSKSRAPKSGMRLGRSAKTNSLMRALAAEDGLKDVAAAAGQDSAAAAAAGDAVAAAAAPPVQTEDVVLRAEEKLVVECTRDGGVEAFECRGTLSLVVGHPDLTRIAIQLSQGQNEGFQMQSHPNIDKRRFAAESVLALKNANKAYPVGNPVSVLRWRLSSKDESALPLTINCWPELSGANMHVNIEYSLEREGLELGDLQIVVPLGTAAAPAVENADGTFRHDSKNQCLVWTIDSVDSSNATGSLEFQIPQRDEDAFFPVQVTFRAMETLCDVRVVGVVDSDEERSVRHSSFKELAVESYTVQ